MTFFNLLISEYCTFIYYLYIQVVIEQCEAVIKSIELQLVRVETCGCAEGYSRDGKKIIMRLDPCKNGYIAITAVTDQD